MSEADLDVAAARVALGVASDDDRACLSGVDGELRVPLPTAEQAAWTLLGRHLGDIASGRVTPEAGMRRVAEDVYVPAKLGPTQFRPHRDTHDIRQLIALEEEYDDIRHHERRAGRSATSDARRAGVDAQVVREARAWVARNGGDSGASRLF